MTIALHNTYANDIQFTQLKGIVSDGIAYTAINHIHQNAQKGRIEAGIITSADFVRTLLGKKNLFGGSTNDTYWLLNQFNEPANVQFYCGNGSAFCWQPIFKPSEEYIVKLSYSDGIISFSIEQGGITLDQGSGSSSIGMTNGRICLFSQNNVNGDQVSVIAERVPKDIGFTYFKYWDGDMLAASLIPVEDQSGEICFFDLVHKEFLKNLAGTGKFKAINQSIELENH